MGIRAIGAGRRRTSGRAANHVGLATCVAALFALSVSQSVAGAVAIEHQPEAAPPANGDVAPPMTTEEIDALVAPIALHPDALIAQILMASTYPLEVVQAERWMKANPGLTGDALAQALNTRTWDASVKSLIGFPEVLGMMSEKLDWTTMLGDAVIGQQADVLAAIQRLRDKARDAGNLQSTSQQTVNVTNEGGTEVIVIESTSPDVIYVPQYDPVYVYGSWPYPAYPPYYYYPPGYVAGGALIGFGVGLACGAAWGHAWGDCDWHGGDIDIDIDQNFEFNRNIDRESARNRMEGGGREGSWRHDASHRQGVPYRDNATAQRNNRPGQARTAASREQFRGRAEAGQRDIARGSVPNRGSAAGDARSRTPSSGSRPSTSGRGNSAYSGSNRSGSSTRAASNRGSSSRSYSGGSRGGGSRGGGGRGGGGRGGGGRR